MKTLSLSILILLAAVHPAHALKVTNLDKTSHRVAFTATGATEVRTILPNETVEWVGRPDGALSLLSSPHPRTGAPVEGAGLLAHLIGNGRDQNIPVSAKDSYVIWPEGRLLLQTHPLELHGL